MADQHRQTVSDESKSGEQHDDDRTPLAYAYDGTELIAIAFTEAVVEDWLDDAWFEVSLTPAVENEVS